MKYQSNCPYCGHQETAYAHPLNKGLVSAFKALVEYYLVNKKACSVNSELPLTHNQLANFQKLRYFGLVFNNQFGWLPSELGIKWYFRECAVATPAGSFGNMPLAEDHPAWKTHNKPRKKVFITDFVQTNYKRRADYGQERSTATAPTLFDADASGLPCDEKGGNAL